MATNAIFQENGKNNRARVVPEGTKAGDFLLLGDRPAVAYTDRGDEARTYDVADGVSITRPSGGVGFAADEAGVAFDGTWDLPVTGVTVSTGNDVPVYYAAGAEGAPGTLTLTKTGNTLFGYTDYPQENYLKRAGIAPVRIGA